MAYTNTLRTPTLRLPEQRIVTQLIELCTFWLRRARTRRQLLLLEEYRLHDLGLTSSQAATEGRKKFWQD